MTKQHVVVLEVILIAEDDELDDAVWVSIELILE